MAHLRRQQLSQAVIDGASYCFDCEPFPEPTYQLMAASKSGMFPSSQIGEKPLPGGVSPVHDQAVPATFPVHRLLAGLLKQPVMRFIALHGGLFFLGCRLRIMFGGSR